MSVSSEVQRTLVKSPPELWAEVSDPDALSRHLGELGEIRIVCTEPETTVEWEAAQATGRVQLKPSGWGTTVTLSATRHVPQVEPHVAPQSPVEGDPSGGPKLAVALEPPVQAESEPMIGAAPEPTTVQAGFTAVSDAGLDAGVETHPEAVVDNDPETAVRGHPEPVMDARLAHLDGYRGEPVAVVHREPVAILEAPDPQPELGPHRSSRRGFFGRLFGRRRRAAPIEVLAVAIPEDGDQTPETLPAAEPPAEPRENLATAEATREQLEATCEQPEATKAGWHAANGDQETAKLSAELKPAEHLAAEQVTAVLTSVLDRLGAAHHRPFSRA